jgi:hypothetical protein
MEFWNVPFQTSELHHHLKLNLRTIVLLYLSSRLAAPLNLEAIEGL